MQYYRNSIPIEHVEIETLWFLQNGLFILFDADDCYAVPAIDYEKYFYPVDHITLLT